MSFGYEGIVDKSESMEFTEFLADSGGLDVVD